MKRTTIDSFFKKKRKVDPLPTSLNIIDVDEDEKDDQKQPQQTQYQVPKREIYKPLAEKQRPMKLEDIVGQEHVLGNGTPFNVMIKNDTLQSTIIYGPPGCGKTTIARIIEETTKNEFVSLSATVAKKEDFKQVIEAAKNRKKYGRNTIVFVDEIHALNKLQQDTFLPAVENGTIILIGATTENPSYELNNALMSRCQLITLNKLSKMDIVQILRNAIDNQYQQSILDMNQQALKYLAVLSNGDARAALKYLEKIFTYYRYMNKQKLESEMRDNGGIDIELEMKVKRGEVRIIRIDGKIASIYQVKKKVEEDVQTELPKECTSIDIEEILRDWDLDSSSENENDQNDGTNDNEEMKKKMEMIDIINVDNDIDNNDVIDLDNDVDSDDIDLEKDNNDDNNDIDNEQKENEQQMEEVDMNNDINQQENEQQMEEDNHIPTQPVESNQTNESIKEEKEMKQSNGEIVSNKKYIITKTLIEKFLQKNQYVDKQNEEHFNVMNAFHKSITHSDEEASMYWLEKLIQMGENPKYITRRMIRISTEDIGLADVNALNIAIKTFQICSVIGYPECNTTLYECALYLARAPKSCVVLESLKRTDEIIKQTGSLPVPFHIRNAPTDLMMQMGYSDGYKYPPNYNTVLDQTYLPTELIGTKLVYHDKFVPIINKDDIIMKKDNPSSVHLHEKPDSSSSPSTSTISFIKSSK